MWLKHAEDSMLPEWLRSSLSSTCSYCQSPMLNYYNDDYRCTNRKCSNPTCPGIIAARGEFIMKLLGVKGVGFKTCLTKVKGGGVKDQVKLLPIFGVKPTVTLYDYLRLHCFSGVDGEWEKICKKLDVYTLDELFNSYDGKFKSLLLENKDLLYDDLQYVNLVEKPKNRVATNKRIYLTIMITGTPNGYSSKDQFVDTLNANMLGKIVIIHQRTKKQTGVDYLIREQGSTTRGKVEAAIRGGIPIVTSSEFIGILIDKLKGMAVENNQ